MDLNMSQQGWNPPLLIILPIPSSSIIYKSDSKLLDKVDFWFGKCNEYICIYLLSLKRIRNGPEVLKRISSSWSYYFIGKC